jgi:hypothetical protein
LLSRFDTRHLDDFKGSLIRKFPASPFVKSVPFLLRLLGVFPKSALNAFPLVDGIVILDVATLPTNVPS